MAKANPRKWRYTWEAQSHLPILKLFLFSPQFNPISHCNNLTVDLFFEKSLLNLTWNNQIQNQNPQNLVSLIVPLPRVLVDLESPLNFRALDDHIEVKIPLLLPVDHPIVSSFISDLNSADDSPLFYAADEFLTPLSMDSDFKELSSKGDIEFCCRSCGFKLTKRSVRCLVDLPSVNWTDVADNWFGSCCCSFGSISEKLVAKYAKLYRCAEGSCLLTPASVILCKDDVVGFRNLAQLHIGKCDDKTVDDSGIKSNYNVGTDLPCSTESSVSHDSSIKPDSMQLKKEEQSVNGACSAPDDHHNVRPSSTSLGVEFTESEHHCCAHDAPSSFPMVQELNAPVDLQTDQKSLLNCYLGNAFLFGASGLSNDIEWVDFSCPQCSHILGAYPSTDGSEPLDGGIRLLKCYISISSPSNTPDKLFRKYTLERMFTCQLLESAKDELSFRTVVKDLEDKCPMVNIILVNPNSWCCSGWCSEDTPDQFLKINLQPIVKLLFSLCSDTVKSEVRITQEWELKHQVDEVYMLKLVIKELIKSMEKAKDSFPSSFSSTQGFLLSSIPR